MAAQQQPEPFGPGEDDEEDLSERPSEKLKRDADLLGRKDSPFRKWLAERFKDILKGFQDQANRSDDLDKWWNCYNCKLDDNQFYNGNATVYVPIIRDAINARVTRFSNQLFPTSGRYIDCTSADGSQPFEIIAIANHYIQASHLKTAVIKPLLRNGDVEGQYNLYVDWQEFNRVIVSRETRPARIPSDMGPVESPDHEIEVITEEPITEGRPLFEVLHDSDVLVLPASADSVEHAINIDGMSVIVRRYSEDKIKLLVEDGEIREEAEEDLISGMIDSSSNGQATGLTDLTKQLIRAVGIRGGGKHALTFEVWMQVPLNDKGAFSKKGEKRICKIRFDIKGEPIGARRNPFWNDRCPLMSWPVEKVAGVFKGKSAIEALAPIQWEANDAANERADADHYAAMPIIMRKPDGDNAPLILNLAAVWDTDPNTTKFAEFPDLSQRARARVMDATQLIFQSLGVNPAMLPQQSGGKSKRNQAEIAMEQQVDLLTTAEAASVISAGLNEAVAWIVDLDHQFRDNDLTVRAYGEMGIQARMIDVPPLQNRHRYMFEWCGAEQARLNAAMMQSLNQLLNIARGMGQQLKEEGYQLRIGPALERAFLNVGGPQMAADTLRDMRRELSIEIPEETKLLHLGFTVPVHVLDNDAEHLKAHTQQLQMEGDPHGVIRVHIQKHLHQQALKTAAMAQHQMAAQSGIPQPGGRGAPGVPGRPGVAGTPRPGAVPAATRPAQAPAGAIHADRLPGMGVVTMPRKF